MPNVNTTIREHSWVLFLCSPYLSVLLSPLSLCSSTCNSPDVPRILLPLGICTDHSCCSQVSLSSNLTSYCSVLFDQRLRLYKKEIQSKIDEIRQVFTYVHQLISQFQVHVLILIQMVVDGLIVLPLLFSSLHLLC